MQTSAVNKARRAWGKLQPTRDLVPLCFVDMKQFRAWLHAGVRGDNVTFCDDCTPAYERKMANVGRCAKASAQLPNGQRAKA